MNDNTTIPRHDDTLYIDDQTTEAEVMDYVAQRLRTPAVLGDVIVYNFSNYTLDGTALVNAAADLDAGLYVVPYQVPGMWGYIVHTIPDEVADATLLTYRSGEGAYHAYPNWRPNVGTAQRTRMAAAFRAGLQGQGVK
jgi:hypothetical protein